jgi:Phosphotransferase system, mannose/fructose/N-acetylgalactosamine-specific component IIB
MANIVLTRIDSRLIHGQVIAKWLKKTNANSIVVIDDALSKDDFMKKIYLMAAPPGCKVKIISVVDAIASWNKDQLGPTGTSVIMLFKEVKSALDAYQRGLGVKHLQVGGLPGAPGRRVVFKNITLDENDAKNLKAIQDGGVDIIFQTVPEDKPSSLNSILKSNNL